MNAPSPIESMESPARAWLRALETTARATRDPARILPRAVNEWAAQRGERAALVSERETLSYCALAGRMNRYSRWALAEKIAKGETVALMMGNRPEYFAIWLGLTQIGAIVALVSPQLRADGLAHALHVSAAVKLIVAEELADVANEAITRLPSPLPLWTHGGSGALTGQIETMSEAPLAPEETRDIALSDRALRIFTSGTTGLPKAAEISHRRIVTWTHWFAGLAGLGPADRLYNCLPMHHSVGGVVAIGAPLVNGGSVVIAEKFSVRGFWADAVRWECTAFQYIGELCRYLAAAPARPEERRHKFRLALGNGLSADVWRACLGRFGPLRVLEFYASTEGNVWLYNVEGRIGALGRAPPYIAARESIALARFDPSAQAPWRGADGFAQRCQDEEAGEALGRISADANAEFEGYSDARETEKKILRDVFARGDAWMRTGDLMRRDSEGFYYFVDRIGDTFRWKGENVSTSEVAAVLSASPDVAESIVYGVAAPNADGRAGMALLRQRKPIDLAALAQRLESLPTYARPVFLRLADAVETTETFKPKRGLYIEQGFDPKIVADPIYYFDGALGAYALLNADRYAQIHSGEIRL